MCFHKAGTVVIWNSLTLTTDKEWKALSVAAKGGSTWEGGLPMKIQTQEIKNPTQGILWSREDRGNGLFTFLGGRGFLAGSRLLRQEGNWPQDTQSLWRQSLGPGDTHSAWVRTNRYKMERGSGVTELREEAALSDQDEMEKKHESCIR